MNLRALESIAQQLGGIFSLQQIQLYEPNFLRSNLIRWQKQWYIVRISRWWYSLASQSLDETSLYCASNLIYSPSYISMESALRYYDLIPEGVYMTTACTTKKTQTLKGDLGTFYYYHIKNSLFWGYTLQKNSTFKREFLLAWVEKVICDFFYLKPYLKKSDFSELRIDQEHLWSLTTAQDLLKCAAQFNHPPLYQKILNFIDYLS